MEPFIEQAKEEHRAVYALLSGYPWNNKLAKACLNELDLRKDKKVLTKKRAVEVLSEKILLANDGLTTSVLDKIDELLLKKKKTMKTTTFENARAGDRVWDTLYGWGTIYEWRKDRCLFVKFDKGPSAVQYTLTGYYLNGYDAQRTLYWNELKFEIPCEPMRKVKKTFWVNIYTTNSAGKPIEPWLGTSTYTTEALARQNAVTHCKSLPYKIEVEVEE
jgi:hypothetical protein